ncbi:hypothetical protein GF360_00365 [candidate division WWE3 bacterium]|nr:hypothetical protein [candidate division WWE3 bacterium]
MDEWLLFGALLLLFLWGIFGKDRSSGNSCSMTLEEFLVEFMEEEDE